LRSQSEVGGKLHGKRYHSQPSYILKHFIFLQFGDNSRFPSCNQAAAFYHSTFIIRYPTPICV